MSKKPNPMSKAELEDRRARLDRVLAAAKAECSEMVRIYDCAVWLLYACSRDDARSLATEALEGEDEDEIKDRLAHSPKDELVDMMEAAHDDRDMAVGLFEDEMELGKLLDPGFDKPILEQEDWLAEKPDSTR